ncbi:MAG: nucleotide exchange factor GrpE [Clostridiaceae bacterium]|nr:nucleotide exchange factor GrpE [Clostridiaceae bacterium]
MTEEKDKTNGVTEGTQEVEEQEEIHNNKDAVQDEMQDQNHNDDVASLKSQLQQKEEESKDYFDRLTRLQADFSNYKKRVEKEKSDIHKYANEKLALDLLDIVDNLERALGSEKVEGENNGLYQGVELVFKQLKNALQKHSIEEIDALNKPFDLNLHHAVMREASDAASDEVVEVLQKGYTIHGKVIRPAMVKVAE